MPEVAKFAAAAGRCSASATGSRFSSRQVCCRVRCCETAELQFRCEFLHVSVEQTDTPFTVACRPGQIIKVPIAHGEGNYYAEPDVVERLEQNRQVVFRYVSSSGEMTEGSNPNGSVNNIAGICNEARNVVGLMPHPERACELAVGSADGLVVFQSLLKWGRESLLEGNLTAMTNDAHTVVNR